MQTISAEEAYKKLQQPDTVCIDVRTPGEFSGGHIKDAINMPLDTIADIIPIKIPDKSQCMYLYCLSGSRSTQAAMLLEKLGYTNIFNIQSGLLAWRIKQLPLVK